MPISDDPARALGACRERIDSVDLRILEMLNERTSIVQEIGRIKSSAQLPVYEPRREDQVFANVTSHNQGPLPDDALRRIFERIIDEMRKVQKDRMEKSS
jgi:chorismate mutase